METLQLVAVIVALASCYVLYLHTRRASLAQIRGPAPTSFLLGNTLELYQEQAGKTDFEWQRLYGSVVRFKSIFGEDQLLIADPKALHHILNTSEHVYSSQPERRAISGFINGKGVAWTRGPCFGFNSSSDSCPYHFVVHQVVHTGNKGESYFRPLEPPMRTPS